jgi:bifunctional enzyme CysN/CysC
MGIKQVILAINKMDLVNYSQSHFLQIQADFISHTKEFEFENITAIPLSALLGDNITKQSKKMDWYLGSTLINSLEKIFIHPSKGGMKNDHWVMPIQMVNRPHSQFRGFSGSISAGVISVGDTIRVTASGQTSKVKEILTPETTLSKKGSHAGAGEAITLSLTDEVDISRGDVLTLADSPLSSSDQFEVTIIWLDQTVGLTGRNYDLILATQQTTASLTSIKHRINVNTLEKNACRDLKLNDIALCNIALSKPIAYEAYKESKELGGFILIDRYTNATVAAGLIRHSLRRADNVHTQTLSINREHRERKHGHKGKVIWFTGLSGSGKSTLANALEVELYQMGKHTYLLDGDNIRQGLNKDLGFTDVDRIENIRRIAEVSKLMMDAGLIAITAFISPFKQEREMARKLIGEDNFIEIYVDTPIKICEQRDPKGLYKKVRSGKLPNFSGISSPYEAPDKPSIIINGTDSDSIRSSVLSILDLL